MRCWKHSPLGKPLHSHRCMRSLNAVCKCKMCTSAFSMDGQRWFRCRWWSVDSPLHPRRHRRRWLISDLLHRPPWMSIWRHHHRLRRLQRQLLVVRHLHQCLWSSGPLLPVVDSPRVPSMLHVDALSSPAIAQMGWPHLPPPMGGPNGPRSGCYVGRFGGRGGVEARPLRGQWRSALGAARLLDVEQMRGRWLSGARCRALRGGPWPARWHGALDAAIRGGSAHGGWHLAHRTGGTLRRCILGRMARTGLVAGTRTLAGSDRTWSGWRARPTPGGRIRLTTWACAPQALGAVPRGTLGVASSAELRLPGARCGRRMAPRRWRGGQGSQARAPTRARRGRGVAPGVGGG
jgi:hypothetical protein